MARIIVFDVNETLLDVQTLSPHFEHMFGQMPVMDGFETAHLIREREKSANTPIIFLTASYPDASQAFKGYSVGAVDYLHKPIIPQILISKVGVFVELARKNAQLRRLNEALDAQAAQLATANRELESFSSSVSHDLRAPLRGITGFSQLLLENHAQKLDEGGKAYLKRIQQAGHRMGELIDDLLQLARVTRTELTRERVDLGKLAREVAAELSLEEPARKVEFHAADGLFADADARLLRGALENLLGNAWKFTQKVPVAKIDFGADADGFFLRDNGAGFDPGQKELLFEPFQRLHTASEFPGTGIGLAIVQRIISRHGGRIWAQSRVGEGAVFHFNLQPGAPAPHPPPTSAPGRSKGAP